MIPPFRACGQPLLRRCPTAFPSQISRRWKTTSTTASGTPPTTSSATSTTQTPKTIPGPSWLWLEPIATPFRAYGRAQRRKPYLTQFLSALVIYFFGDISAQNITVTTNLSPSPETENNDIPPAKKPYDPHRTLRALLIGGLSSIPSYKWFIWLGNSFNYSSKTLSLTTKVVVNQIVFTPLFNSYFFGMQSLLTGASLVEVGERIKHTVPVSWVNSCKIWPVVTAVSFAVVPEHYRSVFAGVIAIGWQTYLSLLNQRAALAEQVAHEPAKSVGSQMVASSREQRAEA